ENTTRTTRSCLPVAGTMRCRSVKIADADGDRFCAALKIWPYWCSKHTELIFIRRLYTDDSVGSKHVRAHIQSSPGAIWRHVGCIGLYCLMNSLHESVLRKYRHFQSLCAVCHPGCI